MSNLENKFKDTSSKFGVLPEKYSAYLSDTEAFLDSIDDQTLSVDAESELFSIAMKFGASSDGKAIFLQSLNDFYIANKVEIDNLSKSSIALGNSPVNKLALQGAIAVAVVLGVAGAMAYTTWNNASSGSALGLFRDDIRKILK